MNENGGAGVGSAGDLEKIKAGEEEVLSHDDFRESRADVEGEGDEGIYSEAGVRLDSGKDGVKGGNDFEYSEGGVLSEGGVGGGAGTDPPYRTIAHRIRTELGVTSWSAFFTLQPTNLSTLFPHAQEIIDLIMFVKSPHFLLLFIFLK